MPWPDLMTAMEAERHAFWLASQSSEEDQRLVSAIMDETERLFYNAEQAGLAPFADPPET